MKGNYYPYSTKNNNDTYLSAVSETQFRSARPFGRKQPCTYRKEECNKVAGPTRLDKPILQSREYLLPEVFKAAMNAFCL